VRPSTSFRRLAVPSGLLAAAVLLAACGGGDSGDNVSPAAGAVSAGPASGSSSAGSAGQAQAGGTLSFAVGSDAGCLDPQQVGSNDSIYSVRQLVDSLTDQDPETGELKPWLAESWEANDDATEYTFTLRSGVTFSDGTALDAEAVKANFDRVADLGVRGSLPKSYLSGYKSTEVTGPLEFTVSFEAPTVQFLQGTSTHSLGILAPKVAKLSDDERCAAPIGSGPFTVESYAKDDTLVLAKRADYDWPSDLARHTGPAYLDTLEFRIVPESGVRTGSLQSGEVDAIGTISQQDEEPLKGAGAQLPSRPNPGIPIGLWFNQGKAPTNDLAVRKALSESINRDEVAGAVYTTNTPAATSVLSSTTPGYADQGDLITFDPDDAKATLDAAGWVAGADGIREKDGQRLSIDVVYFNNYAPSKPSLELIQQQAKLVGIELKLTEHPIADVTSILQEGEFGATFSGLTRADPDILRTSFSTELANLYRLEPSELDKVLDAQAGEPDPDKRKELVAQAQQL